MGVHHVTDLPSTRSYPSIGRFASMPLSDSQEAIFTWRVEFSALLMDVYVSRSVRDFVATSSTGRELGQPLLRHRPCDEEVVRPDAT